MDALRASEKLGIGSIIYSRLDIYISKGVLNTPLDLPDRVVVRCCHVSCLATWYIL